MHRAATVVADHIERCDRGLLGADGIKQPGHREVVDVVAGPLGQCAGIAPTRQPTDYQTRVACQQVGWRHAQTLEHARAKALEQHIGLVDERQRFGQSFGTLEVDRKRRLAVVAEVEPRIGGHAKAGVGRWRDARDARPQTAQQLACEGHRSDGMEFDDPDALEGAGVG